MADQRDDELGALWEKEGTRGTYMTGKIQGVSVVVFKNTNKRGEKQPDWRILKAKPREQQAPSFDTSEPF